MDYEIELRKNVATNGRWFLALIILICLFGYRGYDYSAETMICSVLSIGCVYLGETLGLIDDGYRRVGMAFSLLGIAAGALAFIGMCLVLVG